jgi:hypothetical protein
VFACTENINNSLLTQLLQCTENINNSLLTQFLPCTENINVNCYLCQRERTIKKLLH